MNKIITLILGQRRLMLTLAVMMTLSGVTSWMTMPRQEDPRLPPRVGLVTVVYPGADPLDVERLIIKPVEDELATVPQIVNVSSTARLGFAAMTVQLSDATDLQGTERAWEEVRQALELAQREFPKDARPFELDDSRFDQDSIVIAVDAPDWLQAREAARELKDELLSVEGVKRAQLFGDPGQQITIALNPTTAQRYGISLGGLTQLLASRNVTTPGGTIVYGERTIALRPMADFKSIEELRRTPILLKSGASVELGELAQVSLEQETPETGWMRLQGRRVVGVGVIPKENQNISRFGKEMQARLEQVRASAPAGVSYSMVFEQPKRLDMRLSELLLSLLQGTLIVAFVLVLFMGPRLGLLVASVVPMVAMSSLAMYAWGGGVLHQISIAALVIALGLLVDNAIVVAEAIQLELDQGKASKDAIIESVRQLALPLATATGTTLAAFVPMLLAQGPTGDFTRAIPIVVMITLVTSYIFAIAITPTLAGVVLRAGSGGEGITGAAFAKIGGMIGGVAQLHPIKTLLFIGALLALSLMALPRVSFEFFPKADRNQLMIEIELPEGSHLQSTDEVTQLLERELLARPEVVGVSSYVGQGLPHFYYNVIPQPRSPHLAQLVVVTKTLEQVEPLAAWVRTLAATQLPQATVIPKVLGQGPPVRAPLELRIYAKDLGDMQQVTQQALKIISGSAYTRSVRHDLGTGTPTLEVTINDAAAARAGLTRADVSSSLLARTRGLPAGELRAVGSNTESIKMVVRDPAGEFYPASRLATLEVEAGPKRALLDEIANTSLTWRPAVIRRRDRARLASILAELEPAVTFSQALKDIEPQIKAMKLPEGVRIEWAGASAESNQANASILRNMPIAIMLLLFFLLIEFNSFRRVGIILGTIPLSIMGIVPGLLWGNQPFGFMSLLGSIALVGILVNNAIVLIDQIEHRRREGLEIPDAVREAVITRTRPILLTVITTIAGMLPLALSNTSLWPPMAWTIIFGLMASTLLTLAVVPALYVLIFERGRFRRRAKGAVSAGMIVMALTGVMVVGSGQDAHAQELSLKEALKRAQQRPRVQGAEQTVAMAQAQERLVSRQAWWPSLQVEAAAVLRAPKLEIQTPIGAFSQGKQQFITTTTAIKQPLLSPALLWGQLPAATASLQASEGAKAMSALTAASETAEAYFEIKLLDAQLEAAQQYVANLEARLSSSEAAKELGAAIANDSSRLSIARDRAAQDVFALKRQREVLGLRLGQSVGQELPAWPTAALPEWEIPSEIARAKRVALERHPALAAQRGQRDEAQANADGIWWELIPSLSLQGAFIYSTEERVATDWIAQGSLNLVWTPLAAGTRAARQDLFEAQALRVRHELTETQRAITLSVERAFASYEIITRDVEVWRTNVELAADNLRIQEERQAQGQANVVDIVEAETLLRVARASYKSAQVQRALARVRILGAMGTLGL